MDKIDNQAPIELERRRGSSRERTRIGIASMPGREKTLASVLRTLAPQADEVFVYLNDMISVPEECLFAPSNVRFFTGPDLGDRGKFAFLKGFVGYYLTVDDDINYAKYHVNSIINGIEKYERRAVVGWHGVIFQEPFDNYYDPRCRKVYHFRDKVTQDTAVHLLGTGASGFHTDTLRLEMSDFSAPNMADIFMAIAARDQGIQMVALAHEAEEARPLKTTGSISAASQGKDTTNKEKFDLAHDATQLVKDSGPWPDPALKVSVTNARFKVALIGRTDTKRWKKGGIPKSCALIREMLLPHQADVQLIDHETEDMIGLNGFRPDIVLVYVGDPRRHDFKHVWEAIEFHASSGTPVLVNLSEDNHPDRHQEIVNMMTDWWRRYEGRISMMTFTNAVDTHPAYQPFREAIVPIPKTLHFQSQFRVDYDSSSGIFVGDVAKLSDSRIVGPDVQLLLRELRQAVPEAPLIGVQQYKPRFGVPKGIDEIWPFMPEEEFAERLSRIRLMVTFARYATFEMVPVEAAALGMPILYPDMPQSLNSVLGLGGARFRDSFELVTSAQTIYRDPLVWRQYSVAGQRMARAQDFDVASSQLYLALKNFVARQKGNI